MTLCLQHKCERHKGKHIDSNRFAVDSHRLKQLMLCGKQVVVLQVIDQLFRALCGNSIELDPSCPRLPLEIVKFVK